jgi:hypothetical protein
VGELGAAARRGRHVPGALRSAPAGAQALSSGALHGPLHTPPGLPLAWPSPPPPPTSAPGPPHHPPPSPPTSARPQEGSELFLLPGIDMLNHASDPSRRCTSLLKFDLPMDVEVEGVGLVQFRGFFSMKAGERCARGLGPGGWAGAGGGKRSSTLPPQCRRVLALCWYRPAPGGGRGWAAGRRAGAPAAGGPPPPATTCCPAPPAERDIAGGEQVLHTYGDLSDAQLLQT